MLKSHSCCDSAMHSDLYYSEQAALSLWMAWKQDRFWHLSSLANGGILQGKARKNSLCVKVSSISLHHLFQSNNSKLAKYVE